MKREDEKKKSHIFFFQAHAPIVLVPLLLLRLSRHKARNVAPRRLPHLLLDVSYVYPYSSSFGGFFFGGLLSEERRKGFFFKEPRNIDLDD